MSRARSLPCATLYLHGGTRASANALVLPGLESYGDERDPTPHLILALPAEQENPDPRWHLETLLERIAPESIALEWMRVVMVHLTLDRGLTVTPGAAESVRRLDARLTCEWPAGLGAGAARVVVQSIDRRGDVLVHEELSPRGPLDVGRLRPGTVLRFFVRGPVPDRGWDVPDTALAWAAENGSTIEVRGE